MAGESGQLVPTLPVETGRLEINGQPAAFWAKGRPTPGHETGDAVIFDIPGLGTTEDTVEWVADRIAALSGLTVVSYVQGYKGHVSKNPFVEIPEIAGRTLSQLMTDHAGDDRKKAAAGQSASGISLFGNMEQEPGRLDAAIFNSSLGWDVRSTVGKMFNAQIQEQLDGMSIADRAAFLSLMRGGRARGLLLMARFSLNGLFEGVNMALEQDWGPLRQAVVGIAAELWNNRNRASDAPAFKNGPVALGAFAMGGNLDGTPTSNKAHEKGTKIGLVHGNNDPIFRAKRVKATIAMEGVQVDATDFFSGSELGEGGHDMLTSEDGDLHNRRVVKQARELLAEAA